MSRMGGIAAAVAWCVVLLPPVLAQGTAPSDDQRMATAVHREAERARIQRERGALEAARPGQEAACYQRFAVADCLRGVRARAREAQDRSGLAIRKIVRQLRPLRSATIAINGTRQTFEPEINDTDRALLDALHGRRSRH